MPQYFYGVRDRQGNRQSGVVTATNPGDALARLRDRFPLVLRLDEVGSGRRGLARWMHGDRVSEEDLLAFTHQLSSMLSAGLSFGAAMEILLLDRVHGRAMRRVLVDLAASVSEGRTFSDSLRAHPETFPELYVSLVEAGENSASLPAVLQRLAVYLEKTARIKMELLSALLYPVVVLCFGFFVATGTLAYAAPILSSMYAAAGATLPFLSRMFIMLGTLVRDFGVVLFPILGVFVFFLPAIIRMPHVRAFIDRALLNFGPFRDLLLEAGVARCCRTLATLYSGGVPVLSALDMTARSSGNVVLRDLFLQVREKMAAGSNLSEPLLASPLFPPMAAGMITAGEAAGDLPHMLDHLASYYETRLDFALKAFSKLVEPFLVVFIGVLVGIVVLALGLPFLNLVAVFG